jgi:hypothetical protein
MREENFTTGEEKREERDRSTGVQKRNREDRIRESEFGNLCWRLELTPTPNTDY